MSPIELLDILTLDDDKEYVVANMLKKDDKEYLYLIEIDENEDPIGDNQKMARRVIKDGDESLEILEGEEQKEIGALFFKLFSEDIKDEEA